MLRLSKSNTLGKFKGHFLTSLKGYDVTIRAPRANFGNVMLTVKEAKQDFLLQFATSPMLQSCFLSLTRYKTCLHPSSYPINTLMYSEFV